MKTLVTFEMTIRLVNAAFTMGIGLLLAYIYIKIARFISLCLWSIAFLLYGIQIFLRIWRPWADIEILLVGIPMSFLLILGTSHIMGRDKYYGATALIILVISLVLLPSNYVTQYAGLAFFAIMTIAVIDLRLVMGSLANRIITGWLILLITNLLFVGVFPLEWVADLVAIPAKGILALGMFDQRFGQVVIGIKKTFRAYNSRQPVR